MTEAAELALVIQRDLPSIKTGTLRFWGEWFGHPHDNQHKIVDVEAQGDTLHILFNEGERLSVRSPAGLDLSRGLLRIENADHVRWEWHSYGHPKTPEHLRYMDFAKTADRVMVTSNAHWQSKILQSFASYPAVEIL